MRFALQAGDVPAHLDATTLAMVEQRGRYAGRTVTYSGVRSCSRLSLARCLQQLSYADLATSPELVLCSGLVEADGTVVLTHSPSQQLGTPDREPADRTAHADDERFVFPSQPARCLRGRRSPPNPTVPATRWGQPAWGERSRDMFPFSERQRLRPAVNCHPTRPDDQSSSAWTDPLRWASSSPAATFSDRAVTLFRVFDPDAPPRVASDALSDFSYDELNAHLDLVFGPAISEAGMAERSSSLQRRYRSASARPVA